ncbi:hypothetical protein PILCRDRAFT_817177 [Piloderma croceum F 1598]|uniref:isopentenyl-diphosphate Delta-isomerase n=1 Tax=Piloderma croceum (strain F 1598) TaxID=765440 RepID=A0A0C3C6B6_PILCF|nr:hypothetical protein PILCRDRAFT_817177 [Piloderma croceum F 1598]
MANVDLSNYDSEQVRLMKERCILVNENDDAHGAIDKKDCHLMKNINAGMLHRAFSVFLFRPSDGKLLLQQRAPEKITFPSMWTNTCCSHPLHGLKGSDNEEDGELGARRAASRKLEHELGIPRSKTPLDEFQYLTRIHYLAPSDGLWGEHEVDYILFITADVEDVTTPSENEVSAVKYVDQAELKAMFEEPKNSFTPWFKLIVNKYLYGWWDQLLQQRKEGKVNAMSLGKESLAGQELRGVGDRNEIIRML